MLSVGQSLTQLTPGQVAQIDANDAGTNGVSPQGEITTLFHFTAPVAGVYSSLTGTNGEIIQVLRTSAATLVAGGTETTASANQARVDEDGLIIEPACVNMLLTPNTLTNATNWTPSAATVAGVTTDPMGGTTAFTLTDTAANAGHEIYQLLTLSNTIVTSISIYAKAGVGTINFLRISTNGGTYSAYFNISTGAIGTLAGTGTLAEVESVGSGWYRCTLTTPTPNSGLVAFSMCNANNAASYLGLGTGTILLWRAQVEQYNGYATTWVNGTRTQETAFVAYPNVGADWCLEVTCTPCGAQSWVRNAYAPIAASGTYGTNNSLQCFGTNTSGAGGAAALIYDNAGGTKETIGGALAVNSSYVGQRRLAFAANGQQRPAVFYDGRQLAPTVSGSGTGIFTDETTGVLQIGCDSQPVTGGFKIREIRLVRQNAPPRRPQGAYSYLFPFFRGYCPQSQCVAFLGDSNTQGNYDVSITAPFPIGTCATLGTTWQPHNYGIGGNTSAHALFRWRADIKGRGYKAMALWIGINDVNANIPAATTIANIQKILAEALADGVTVYPITVLAGADAVGSTKDNAINSINAAIAASGLTVIQAYTSLCIFSGGVWKLNPTYDLDGGSLHLNQTGQTALAALVATAL